MSFFGPKYLFPAVTAVFLAAALLRAFGGGTRKDVAARIWFRLALIFGLVSAWLWFVA